MRRKATNTRTDQKDSRKAGIFDDTCYFLACESREEAEDIAGLQNSEIAEEFYLPFVFWDSKRPITTPMLQIHQAIAEKVGRWRTDGYPCPDYPAVAEILEWSLIYELWLRLPFSSCGLRLLTSPLRCDGQLSMCRSRRQKPFSPTGDTYL